MENHLILRSHNFYANNVFGQHHEMFVTDGYLSGGFVSTVIFISLKFEGAENRGTSFISSAFDSLVLSNYAESLIPTF